MTKVFVTEFIEYPLNSKWHLLYVFDDYSDYDFRSCYFIVLYLLLKIQIKLYALHLFRLYFTFSNQSIFFNLHFCSLFHVFPFFSLFFSVFTISSPISAFLHSVFWNRFLTSTLSPFFNIQIPLALNTYGKKWILQTAFNLNIIILKSQFYLSSFSFF